MHPDPLIPLLGFRDVYKFLEVKLDPTTKCKVVEEGQRVLNANHIVACRVVMFKNNMVQLSAQVISSCYLASKKPHDVSISVRLGEPHRIESHCGCQAGNIACKHTSAVLFHIQRVPFGQIPMQSCTDVAQQWGKLKRKIEEQYAPVTIKKFICEDHTQGTKGKPLPVKVDDPAARQLLLSGLVTEVPSANLTSFFKGRGTPQRTTATPRRTTKTPRRPLQELNANSAASSTKTPRRPLQELNANSAASSTKTPRRPLQELNANSAASSTATPARPKHTQQPQKLFTPHTTQHTPQLATSSSRRKKATPKPKDKVVVPPTFISIINNIIAEGHFYTYIKNFQIPTLGPKEADYFRRTMCLSSSNAILIAFATIHQSQSDWWKIVKEGRISGSIAYQLWTYYDNTAKRKLTYQGWENKIANTFFPKFQGNRHTERGNSNEPLAQLAYERQTGNKAMNLGVVVSPKVPWFAYSPDGLVVDKQILLEYKCPAAGESMSAVSAAAAAEYISTRDGKFYLNKKHKFYGQVQLGMGIMGYGMCHFCIYSSSNNGEVEIIEVPRDDEWLQTFVRDLSRVYFGCVLPYFANKRSSVLAP